MVYNEFLNLEECIYVSILDVNECLQEPPLCSHECRNVPGSFHCICPPGTYLLEDRLSCSGTLLILNWSLTA